MVIKKVESRGALDIAKRVLTTCGQIMRHAVAHGMAERNPAVDIKPSDVLKPTKKTNYARLDQKELPELLHKIDKYDGQAGIAIDGVNVCKNGGANWRKMGRNRAR